jgi:predicted kinase
MSKIALIMSGLPGSGKSTILKDSEFLKNYFDSDRTVTILSSDDYIEARAKEDGKTYSEVFAIYVKDAERNIKDRLEKAIEKGHHIVWDQTNLRIKKRKMIHDSIPTDYRKVIIEFDVPFEVIVDRVKQRGEATGKHIGYGILKSMWDTRERVSPEEGFEIVVIQNGTDHSVPFLL